MAKFHINKNGVPAPCRAQKGNCPYGGSESHYDTMEEAQSAIDKKSEMEYGLLPSASNNDTTKIEISQKSFNEIFPDSWNDSGYQVTGPNSFDFKDYMDSKEDPELAQAYTKIYNKLPKRFFDETKDARYWRLVKSDNIEKHMKNHVINIGREEAEDYNHGYENMMKTIKEKTGSNYHNFLSKDLEEINPEFERELTRFATEKAKEESFLSINGEKFYVSTDEELDRNWAEEYFNSDSFDKYINKK